jgi:hypothetical protein
MEVNEAEAVVMTTLNRLTQTFLSMDLADYAKAHDLRLLEAVEILTRKAAPRRTRASGLHYRRSPFLQKRYDSIMSDFASGESRRSLASKYGYSYESVCEILLRENERRGKSE